MFKSTFTEMNIVWCQLIQLLIYCLYTHPWPRYECLGTYRPGTPALFSSTFYSARYEIWRFRLDALPNSYLLCIYFYSKYLLRSSHRTECFFLGGGRIWIAWTRAPTPLATPLLLGSPWAGSSPVPSAVGLLGDTQLPQNKTSYLWREIQIVEKDKH